MDGLSLYASCLELKTLTGGKLDKIQQPGKDELLLSVRVHGETKRLLLSASASQCRAQLTQLKYENPPEPPMFCMLLRKRLAGARIADIEQPGMDRVLHIGIFAVNELGDEARYTLAAEIMGKYSNIILINENGVIIDAIRHVGLGMSNVRLVMPRLKYEAPPQQQKLDPRTATLLQFRTALESPRIDKALSAAFMGLSPTVAAALTGRISDKRDGTMMTDEELDVIAASLYEFYQTLAKDKYSPTLQLGANDEPLAIYPFDPGGRIKRMPTMALALDEYYEKRDLKERMNARSAALRRMLQTNIERCEKKLSLYNDAINSEQDAEKLRLYGELLTANLHSLKQGENAAVLNYYEDPPQLLTIPMDKRYTPNVNAQRYYKKYQKAKSAREMAHKQRIQTLEELNYLEGQLDNLGKCTLNAELMELVSELKEQGYIRRGPEDKKQQKLPASKPLCFISSDGVEIYVGKNNRQNDRLTTKIASNDDMWLHTKDIPGSHVIIKSGAEPPKQTLYEAALLAAYYSKARGSQNVAVDYTPRKYVKKPAGAKPGMVIYTTNRTAYVTPSQTEIERIKPQ